MAKQRYIKDSFWTDPYIEKLSPDYKLVFLYLLTNPLSNISGVYEVRLKRMAFETGYDIEVIENILNKFVKDNKIIQHGNWIIIKNHIKHQSIGDLTAKGINREIQEAPQEIQELFEEKLFTNTKGEQYSLLLLKEDDKPLISPLQAPTFGAYSEVKLSKVKLDKIKYGEFENVLLTQEEIQKLNEKFGEKNTPILIEELSAGIASKGYKYKNHYATLINWGKRKVQDYQNNNKPKRTII